jgi:hypothetical protein
MLSVSSLSGKGFLEIRHFGTLPKADGFSWLHNFAAPDAGALAAAATMLGPAFAAPIQAWFL